MDDGDDGGAGPTSVSQGGGGSHLSAQHHNHLQVYSQLQLSQTADVISRICQLLLGEEFYREQLVTLMAHPDDNHHLGVNVR